MKHPNAEILNAIAEGKNVEWRLTKQDATWWQYKEGDSVSPLERNSEVVWRVAREYVHFTSTVLWPAPERVAPAEGTRCYIPSFVYTYAQFIWEENENNRERLESGLIHLSSENAEQHSGALRAASRAAV